MAMSRKKKIIIGVTALTILLAVLVVGGLVASRSDTPEVTVVTIERRPVLESNVTASGEVRPIQFINLTSEVQGRIEDIYVKEGDKVDAGTPLVKLDPTQLQSSTDAQRAAYEASRDDVQVSRSQIIAAQNQLSQSQQALGASQAQVSTAQQQVATARQNVVAAQTDVDRERVNLNTAERELKRTTELLEADVASRFEYDQAKDRVETAKVALRNAQARLKAQQLAVNEAQARVKEAQARARQQQVAVRDARRNVSTANFSAQASSRRSQQAAAVLSGQRTQRDKTLQVAPISGVIADIPSKVGTFAVAGLSTTALLTIADMSTVNVEVKVDETEIDKVSVGQPVAVKVDALGERELTGKVTQKTPLAVGKSQTTGGLSTNINVQEAKEFRVVIELTELEEEIRDSLRPGMSATAVITTKVVKDVVAVPLQAVVEKKADETPTPEAKGDLPEQKDKPETVKGVFVLDNKKVKFVEVETGITGESDIQITAGLSENQEVITGPSRVLNKLKEGDVVKKQVKKEGGEPGSPS